MNPIQERLKKIEQEINELKMSECSKNRNCHEFEDMNLLLAEKQGILFALDEVKKMIDESDCLAENEEPKCPEIRACKNCDFKKINADDLKQKLEVI